MRTIFVIVISSMVLSCAGVAPKQIANENAYVTQFFNIVDTYCRSASADPEDLEARLNASPGLTAVPGDTQTTYVSHFKDVEYGVFVEKKGCAVDMIQRDNTAQNAVSYRQFYAGLKTRGYERYGGLVMRGDNVDRHYLASDDKNTLLYIPDKMKYGMQYISLYTELFDGTGPSVFPRNVVYVRQGLKTIHDDGDTGLNDSHDLKRVSRGILNHGAVQLQDGRVGYGNGLVTLFEMGGAVQRLCYSEDAVNSFLTAVDYFESGNQEYLDMGMDQLADDASEHALMHAGSIAQILSQLGEFTQAVRYYKRAYDYFGGNLKSDDPLGYYIFAMDYSDALYHTGQISEAAGWYRRARKIESEARQAISQQNKRYRQIKRCDMPVDNTFYIDDKKAKNAFQTKDGEIRVRVDLAQAVNVPGAIGGKYNIRLESDDKRYSIISIRHRTNTDEEWHKVHRSKWGIKSSEISKNTPLDMTDWPVLMKSGNGNSIFTVEYILRSEDRKFQTIALNFQFNDPFSMVFPGT